MTQPTRIESYTDLVADLIGAIDTSPKTLNELLDATDLSKATARKFLHALKDRGVLECRNQAQEKGAIGRVPFVWSWVKR